MPAATKNETFRLTFEAVPSSLVTVPPILRVRKLLKSAARSWALKCTKVEDLTDEPQGETSGEEEPAEVAAAAPPSPPAKLSGEQPGFPSPAA